MSWRLQRRPSRRVNRQLTTKFPREPGAGESPVTHDGLVHGQGSVPTILQMTWFDRSGSILSRLGDPGLFETLSLSPDQQTVAVSLPAGNLTNLDVWLFNVVTGSRSQLTRNPGRDGAPVWSPDGKSIAVEAVRDGKVSLRQLSIDGKVDEVLIEDGPPREAGGDSG